LRHRHFPFDLKDMKAALRAEVLARRDAVAAEERTRRSNTAATHVRALPEISAAARVSAFLGLGTEIETLPLLRSLHRLGHEILLPRVVAFGQPLRLHRWRPGEELIRGRRGLLEPHPEAPELVPDAVVTPLVAFDRSGTRLGYGGGFYDRTFAAMLARGHRPPRIGLAFSCQEVDAVPRVDHDLALDLVVTEAGVLRF
jgi:5-formyltetrahydrofolate cyclo-ligase